MSALDQTINARAGRATWPKSAWFHETAHRRRREARALRRSGRKAGRRIYRRQCQKRREVLRATVGMVLWWGAFLTGPVPDAWKVP